MDEACPPPTLCPVKEKSLNRPHLKFQPDIYTPPPDVDNAPSLCAAEFSILALGIFCCKALLKLPLRALPKQQRL